jgi:hypothetical protein
VPSGKIARITLDGNPILLTSRPSPYVFNTTRFSFAIDNSGSFLEETTTKLIINGALKRYLLIFVVVLSSCTSILVCVSRTLMDFDVEFLPLLIELDIISFYWIYFYT